MPPPDPPEAPIQDHTRQNERQALRLLHAAIQNNTRIMEVRAEYRDDGPLRQRAEANRMTGTEALDTVAAILKGGTV